MINITDKSKCCGCNACVQKCPKQCIAMREDEEGFLYPFVDTNICIECGLCEKVCPVLNPNTSRKPLQVLAAKNKNEEQRLRSSSGGIFILLAEYIINHGGVVFGARFDKNWEVEHCYVESLEDIEPLMRSKYVQSRIGNTYKEAERFLKQGRKVLFVGTSCQIAGLKKFLRKEYENLLAVDFICHGVPSPGVWRKYLEEIKNDNPISMITGINFREKQLGGYGWKKYGFVIQKSPSKGDKNTVLLSKIFNENCYFKAFLGNLILRPSCYSCVAKNGASKSDITVADFWGVQSFYSDFDDDKGTGIIFLHTNQGESVLDLIKDKIEKKDTTLNQAVTFNPSYYMSVSIPVKRKFFWKEYNKRKSLMTTVDVALHVSFIKRIRSKLSCLFSRMCSSNFLKM